MTKRKAILILIFLTLIAFVTLRIFQFKQVELRTAVKSPSITTTPGPNDTKVIPLILDVENCETGYGQAYTGTGEIRITITNKVSTLCTFDYYQESEGGYSSSKCQVPTSFKKVTFGMDSKWLSFLTSSPDITAHCKEFDTGNILDQLEDEPPVIIQILKNIPNRIVVFFVGPQ